MLNNQKIVWSTQSASIWWTKLKFGGAPSSKRAMASSTTWPNLMSNLLGHSEWRWTWTCVATLEDHFHSHAFFWVYTKMWASWVWDGSKNGFGEGNLLVDGHRFLTGSRKTDQVFLHKEPWALRNPPLKRRKSHHHLWPNRCPIKSWSFVTWTWSCISCRLSSSDEEGKFRYASDFFRKTTANNSHSDQFEGQTRRQGCWISSRQRKVLGDHSNASCATINSLTHFVCHRRSFRLKMLSALLAHVVWMDSLL